MSSDSADTGSRFREMNLFVRDTGRNCTPAEWRLWVVLWNHVYHGLNTRPIGQAEIANMLGCSIRNVQLALRGLIEKGFVTIYIRGDSRGKASIYTVRAQPQSAVPD